MTAATVRARAQGLQSTDSTTHAITLPASIVVGELLLVAFACDTATTVVSTSSSGWAILANVPQGTSTNHTGVVLWKKATATNTLTVNTSTAEQSTHISIAITNGGTPEETDANGGSAASTSPASITPSGGTADYLCVLCTMTDSSTTTTQAFGVASGFSNSTTQDPGTTQSASTNTQERTYTATATIIPGSVSLGTASEQWVSVTVAVPFQGAGGATTYSKTGTASARGAPGGAKSVGGITYTAPGTAFNLANVWSWTIPVDLDSDSVADEILPGALPTYASAFFYLNGSGQMVATAPVQGATTSGASGATRSEGREWEAGARAAWAFATTNPRQLTVSGYFDPTSITDRKEMIVGQIHGASGTPPLYLSIDYTVAAPRLRVFENGPGVLDLLTNLSPTDLITYRIYVGGGRCKIWAAVGSVANLPTSPQYDKPASTYTDNTNDYLKAGAYNKSQIVDGGTGQAVATITYFDLQQNIPPGAIKSGGSARRMAGGGAKSYTTTAPTQPQWRSTTFNAVYPANVGTGPPPNLAINDYLLCLHYSDGDGSAAAMSAPAGFAQLASIPGAATSPRKCFVKVWGKVATAADVAATSFVFPDSTASECGMILLAIQAGTYDGTNPITVANLTTGTGGSTSSHVAPSTTGVVSGLLVCGFTSDTNGTQRSYTAPSNMTEVGQANWDYISGILCIQPLGSGGATGTRTAALSASRPYNTVSLVINPAVGATTTSKTGGSARQMAGGGAKAVTARPVKAGTSAARGAPGGAKTVSHNLIVAIDPVYVGVAQTQAGFARLLPLGTPMAVGVQTSAGPGTTPAHVVPLPRMAVGVAVGKTSAYSMATTPFGVAVVFPGLGVGFAGTHSGPSLRGVPPIIVPAAVRVMAQTIISKTWVHRELPVSDLQLTYRLSGPNMITGKIDPENRELSELLVALPPWGTWIHVEEGGDVRASGILLPAQTEADGSMSLTAAGVSSYAGRIPFVGPNYNGVNVDPIDVVRTLWTHIQGFPRGDLGVTVVGASGVLIGLPPTFPATSAKLPARANAAKEISAKLKTGDYVNGDWSWTGMPDDVGTYHQSLMDDFLAQGGLGQGRALQEAFLDKYVAAQTDIAQHDINQADGPFHIKADELPAIGRIIDQLGTDCPFDYVEECGYTDLTDKNVVWHRIRCQSPMIGDRLSLNLTQGENILEVGAFEEPDDAYCDSAYVKGAGEGPDSILGYSGVTIGDRLRMPTVVTDKTLMTTKLATSRAAEEVAVRLAAIEELEQIAVNVRHPNSPWGTFRVGDEVLPRVRLPYIGVFAQWHRITQIEYQPDLGIAVLTLTRRAGFGK